MSSLVLVARIVAGLASAAACAGLIGCAGSVPRTSGIDVPPGRYAEAFEAAKDVLRAHAFELDRVDAASGVVTTHARGSAGFATPWVPHSSTLGDAGRGFLDRERRRAVIVFEPANADLAAAPTGDTGASATPEPSKKPVGIDPDEALTLDRAEPLDAAAPLRARVMVWVERVYRPGRRVGSTSVRLASFTSDPELKEQGLEPAFARPVRDDPGLESRMSQAIGARLGGAK